MTAAKLPPLPLSIAAPGETLQYCVADMHDYGLQCYAAGIAAQVPMTREEAVDQVREWRGIPPFEPQCQECGCTLPQHFFHCGLKEIE